MPRIPGELVAKRTSQKKKGLRSKEHKFAVYPPITINMEVNLRIVTLVNVEEKKNTFFCATVKGGGVPHVPQVLQVLPILQVLQISQVHRQKESLNQISFVAN